MDRLKDAAMLLKAKITKDETEELLIQATSEENWQTPTPILHEIANVAYNYEEWQKISAFVWEKLRLKKWRKVLKTLNLVEFLLKNGPSSILSTFKHEVYTFRSLDNFNCIDEGVDRGEAIRDRAKAIVELITNEELLEEERVKAKTIKERLGESGGAGSNYKGIGSKGFGNSGKYQGFDNKGSFNKGSNGGSTDYDSGYSGFGGGLDKYKKELGGDSVYKKSVEEKKREEEKRKKDKQNERESKEEYKQEPDSQNNEEDESQKQTRKAAFQQQGVKLMKPSEAPKLSLNDAPKGKPLAGKTGNTVAAQNEAKKQPTASKEFDFFGEESPVQTPVEQPPQSVPHSAPQPVPHTLPQQPGAALSSLNFGGFQPTNQAPLVPTPLHFPQQQPAPAFGAANFNFSQGQPQYSAPQPQGQLYNQGQGFNYSQGQPATNHQGFSLNQGFNGNQGFAATQGLAKVSQPPAGQAFSFITMGGNQQPQGNARGANQQKDDEFGGFDSGHQQNTWMSEAESNLTDLTELGREVDEKKKEQKFSGKAGSNGESILASTEDFDFISPNSGYGAGLNQNWGVGGQQQKVGQAGSISFF